MDEVGEGAQARGTALSSTTLVPEVVWVLGMQTWVDTEHTKLEGMLG